MSERKLKKERMQKYINKEKALTDLTDLLKIEGLSGGEGQVAAAVRDKLVAAGCKKNWMGHDRVHRKLSGFEVGNLIVKLPGTTRGSRLLYSAHMDTVPLCRGAVPVRRGNRIVSKGDTALGADNRTAVACLITLAETLLTHNVPRPPLTLLFTVGEEIGLLGAKHVKKADLGNPKMGVNIDSGNPAEIIVQAIGAHRLDIEVFGRSAHAGVHPEHGISAALIAARAMNEIDAKGYFGKIVQGKRRGTSNIGMLQGGEATNQVTDRVSIKAETRSHDAAFLERITSVYVNCFERSARRVKNHRGQTGRVRCTIHKDYHEFKMNRRQPIVQRSMRAARSLGLEPRPVSVDGGLDANALNAKGIPTVTIGAGQHSPHTVEEYVDIDEYLQGCALAVAIAGQEIQAK